MSKMIGIKNLVDLEKFLKGEEIEPADDNIAIYYLDEPSEVILIDFSKWRPFRKAPEITSSLVLNDIKLLETIHGRYIPILDRNTKKLLFSEEEFLLYRRKASGIKEYGTGDFIFSDNLHFDGIDYYLDRIDDNIREVDSYRDPVVREITRVLNSVGLSVSIGCNSGGDVELVEAGSTARYTNVPSNGPSKCDLDFTVRFNPELTWKVKEVLETGLVADGHITRTSRYKVRLVDVTIPGLDEKIDLDFSLTPQKEQYLATEEALSERLDNMKEQDYERYRMVIANIMYAKDMLKKSGAYKPARGILDGDRANGGLGGVGIENWVLQYGGSFIDAAQDFVKVAEGKEFLEFEQVYPLMDFGCNHVAKSKNEWPYDNFVVNNMRYMGYEKMRAALIEFLSKQQKETITM